MGLFLSCRRQSWWFWCGLFWCGSGPFLCWFAAFSAGKTQIWPGDLRVVAVVWFLFVVFSPWICLVFWSQSVSCFLHAILPLPSLSGLRAIGRNRGKKRKVLPELLSPHGYYYSQFVRWMYFVQRGEFWFVEKVSLKMIPSIRDCVWTVLGWMCFTILGRSWWMHFIMTGTVLWVWSLLRQQPLALKGPFKERAPTHPHLGGWKWRRFGSMYWIGGSGRMSSSLTWFRALDQLRRKRKRGEQLLSRPWDCCH